MHIIVTTMLQSCIMHGSQIMYDAIDDMKHDCQLKRRLGLNKSALSEDLALL